MKDDWRSITHPLRRRIYEMAARQDGLLWTADDCRSFRRERFTCCFGNIECPIGMYQQFELDL